MRLFAVALLAFAFLAPPALASWAPADKHGFGTARQLDSTVWFTLRQASLSEVYYPDLDTPSFRGLQFAVSDVPSRNHSAPSQAQSRLTIERETVDDDPAHIEPAAVRARVEPVPGSLTFKQITETSRWRLIKTWYTDPARASVLVDVKFQSKTHRPLRLYVLADPAASDTLTDDRGRGMVAWDASSASAVEAEPGLRDASSGYRGTASDPWIDLQDGRLSGSVADTPGDVVQGALTALDGKRKQRMKLAIGFGRAAGAAVSTARASLGAKHAARDYASGWSSYLRSLKRPPASVGRDARLYQQSLMVLAASEDKLNRGASVAAPNMPWVWGTLTLEKPADGHSGPYHLVWPRDFYHVVTAQQAAGDSAAAVRQLDYLWKIQKPDGSWWQNTQPDGQPHWTGLQMDEVALPIVLAWWLDRPDWAHIQKAADFIVANGPKTGQERWENQDGYSPNTIATEIFRSPQRRGREGRRLSRDGRRLAAPRRGHDRDDQRPALAEALLRARHQGRQPERRLDLRPRRQLPAPGRRARDRRQLVPRPGPVRGEEVERPDDPQLARRRRPRAAREHAERPGLAPLLARRVRRDRRRRRLEHLPDRREPDARARVAAADRRARRIRAARRPPRGRLPADDRPHRQRRADAAGAGVREHRRGHPLGHAAGVDARAVHPARLVDPGGHADRAAVDRRAALLRLTRGEILRSRVLEIDVPAPRNEITLPAFSSFRIVG
jgi:Glucodextranase, domain N